MRFQLEACDPATKARAGTINTAHGEIQTPIFMPVGTQGSVKAVHQHELVKEVQAQIILGNTYHLFLRPGIEVIAGAGGLHRFIGWERPMLTDSGGYQVYSLGDRRKLTEEGATFSSHLDGTKYLFTPESVMDIQRTIGADFIMAFDECTPYPCDYAYAANSLELTHRWLLRCQKRFDETEPHYGYEQTLMPIVQGSTFKDLRLKSAEFIAEQQRPANAIGGLSVGEPAEEMYEMTELVCSVLPADRPRYLMGVGTPENLLTCIGLGIDMFDCVLPSRNARHGLVYTASGVLNMKNAKWKEDYSPLDPSLPTAYGCRYSKAYLRHLFVCDEYLALQIATVQNLAFYLWLMNEARQHIIAGSFRPWQQRMIQQVAQRL